MINFHHVLKNVFFLNKKPFLTYNVSFRKIAWSLRFFNCLLHEGNSTNREFPYPI